MLRSISVSDKVAVKLNVPAAVGVPLKDKRFGEAVIPGGTVPDVTVNDRVN